MEIAKESFINHAVDNNTNLETTDIYTYKPPTPPSPILIIRIKQIAVSKRLLYIYNDIVKIKNKSIFFYLYII